jgi:hypothetical protein
MVSRASGDAIGSRCGSAEAAGGVAVTAGGCELGVLAEGARAADRVARDRLVFGRGREERCREASAHAVLFGECAILFEGDRAHPGRLAADDVAPAGAMHGELRFVVGLLSVGRRSTAQGAD